MVKWIAFLRGINVGGQKKIKMIELRERLTVLGLKDVQTYIQSGNLIFESELDDRTKLEKEIHQVIERDFGFDVPVLVIPPKKIETILDDNPFSSVEETKNLYFTLLYQPPKNDFIPVLNPADYPNEEFFITDYCVYLNCKKGAANAKLNNTIIEQKLKVSATTRNFRTMQKVLELAG